MAQAMPQIASDARPQPNVYTVLVIIAALALALTIAVVLWNLMSPPPVGYGLRFEELFDPLDKRPR